MSAPNSDPQRNLHARATVAPHPSWSAQTVDSHIAGASMWLDDSADAARLIEGIPVAVPTFDHRLPELWGGDARTDTPVSAPSPAACRPQAQSAAAAVALMTGTIGLDPDVPTGRIHFRPTGPPPVGAPEGRPHGVRCVLSVCRPEARVLGVLGLSGGAASGAPLRKRAGRRAAGATSVKVLGLLESPQVQGLPVVGEDRFPGRG